nr:class D beta-lactamase [Pseudohalocynthiibacter aestuariivivens]
MKPLLFVVLVCTALLPRSVNAKMTCTVVLDMDTATVLHRQGACDKRLTPASTFKVALALIGFESGYLVSTDAPEMPFKEGYPDWRGDLWRQNITPKTWIEYSVVWYSQLITRAVGKETITEYLQKFSYGNADFSGDAGYDNALERAWIASSLKISADDQIHFLHRMLTHQLPVSTQAVRLTTSLIEKTTAENGWIVHGKTGLAFPRRADRSFDRDRAIGWFVGWAERDDRRVVFAKVIQDELEQDQTPSNRARNSLLRDLPTLIAP